MSGGLRIGLSGKLRSGKDSVANHLFHAHDFEVPVSFGEALKYHAHQIFPDVPKKPKPRELYQFMNVMRDYDPDVWVKHLAKQVEYIEERGEGRGIVVTDARQPNEVAWLRDNGFIIVKVVADEEIRQRHVLNAGEYVSEEQFGHHTERYADVLVADYTIHNHGTLDELRATVDEMVADIKRKDAVV